MASQSFAEEDLSCPVCCDIYINPVLLSCSHSVCSACIQKVWENKTSKECPVCRRTSSNDRLPLNLALRNLCESFQQERSQRSSSEDEMVCSFHKEKLKLFCLDDQQPVCLVCRDSRKHSNHRFCPIDEAAMDNKEILKASLNLLREELRISVNLEQNLCKTAEDIKFHAQLTETQIKEEFEELHQFLHNEEAFRITALREEEEQRNQMMEEKMEETTKQISSLTSIIEDIEEQMKAEDVSFLQNIKATLQRAQYSLPDPDPSPSVTITFTDHLTNLKLNVLQKMQEIHSKTSDPPSLPVNVISDEQSFSPPRLPLSMTLAKRLAKPIPQLNRISDEQSFSPPRLPLSMRLAKPIPQLNRISDEQSFSPPRLPLSMSLAKRMAKPIPQLNRISDEQSCPPPHLPLSMSLAKRLAKPIPQLNRISDEQSFSPPRLPLSMSLAKRMAKPIPQLNRISDEQSCPPPTSH